MILSNVVSSVSFPNAVIVFVQSSNLPWHTLNVELNQKSDALKCCQFGRFCKCCHSVIPVFQPAVASLI